MIWDKLKNRIKHQNQNSDMKIKAAWAAIVAFLSFDMTKENVLTEEHVEKINAEMVRLQADNKKFQDGLVLAKDQATKLGEEKTKLEGEKTKLQNDLTESNGKVTAHEKTIKEHEATINSLKQIPGVEAAMVAAAKETGITEDKSEDKTLDFVSKNEDNTADCITEMRKAGYGKK
jgi:hypothetical protein